MHSEIHNNLQTLQDKINALQNKLKHSETYENNRTTPTPEYRPMKPQQTLMPEAIMIVGPDETSFD
jgi:hypothetical protein